MGVMSGIGSVIDDHKVETAAVVGLVGTHNAQMRNVTGGILGNICCGYNRPKAWRDFYFSIHAAYPNNGLFKELVKDKGMKVLPFGRVRFSDQLSPKSVSDLKKAFFKTRLISGAFWAGVAMLGLWGADKLYNVIKGKD